MLLFKKLSGKGLFFCLNLGTLAAFVWGAVFLLCCGSWEPDPLTLTGFGLCGLFAAAYAVTMCVGKKRVNRNVFIFIFSFVALAELYLWSSEKNDLYSDLFFRWPRPYIMFSAGPDSPGCFQQKHAALKKQLDINESGFRGPMPQRQKQAGAFRVFVLGGSTVFSGMPLSESIAGRLELLFHKDGYRSVEVFNWGQVGYVSGQELALLLYFVCDYSPDLVIFYDGGNDAALPYFLDPRPGYPYNFLGLEAAVLQAENFSFSRMLEFRLTRSSILRRLYRRFFFDLRFGLESLRTKAGYGSKSWRQQIAEAYLGNIDKACRLANAYDFKLAVFLQPLAHLKSPLTGSETKISAVKSAKWLQHATEEYGLFRKGLKRLEIQHSGERFLFADLSRVFQNHKAAAFVDFIHLNNAGNRFVAERIYASLRPWLDGGPPRQ